ncbi:FAD-dependent oxidoreductase [Streptacidiphilus jiangxiensis]|uniref:2-polyprenyl-6-methoxyphenol hydroxylase n=1 Tax=Streptacidiphilus jiangxiensis TaxID=235985 RepID=A0A1H7KJB6_STRJI|nr:NAD(P)/FAD-dependent oxidoreductase [Streptacidiphilus jiangxiensis]SEK86993.1 2-polyprenyl-6-methoxyphenol hydroxylase [Streptacidiphilus jiangxiensis]
MRDLPPANGTCWDVIVCGAGVAGLSAARALELLGLRVLLLEKQRVPVAIAKGEVLQPSSLEVLREWGVLPLLRRRGAVPLHGLAVREPDGRALMHFDYQAVPGRDRGLLSLDYPAILDAFRESLGPGVDTRAGVLVDAPVMDGDRVVGVHCRAQGRPELFHAPLVIAADGRSSRLRRATAVTAEPSGYPHRLLSFELHAAGPEGQEVTSYLSPQGLRLLYPLPDGRLRLYAQVRPEELRGAGRAELERWCADAVAGTPALAPLAAPLRAALGTRQLLTLWRFTATALTAPGLALIGEAAHCVHPMAAQGMNTAIADSATLARSLAACRRVTGAADGVPLAASQVDRALALYAAERRDWVRHMDRMSHDATRLVTQVSWPARALGRRVLRRIDANPRLRHRATVNMAGLVMEPFTVLDRLHQLGLPDPRSRRVPTS